MFSSKLFESLNELAIFFPTLLIIFTSRGFFKALSAKIFGDDTPQKYGFLSLNPLAHVDLVGLTLSLFIIFGLGSLFSNYIPRSFWFIFIVLFGARWSFPVPINEHNFKHYSLGVIFTTLAGSFGNFLAAFIFLFLSIKFPVNLVPQNVYSSLSTIFRSIIDYSIFWGILDLIPLPPFNGGRLLKVLLPLKWHGVIDWLEKYSIFIFMALFFLPGLSNYFFGFIYSISILIKMFFLKIILKF